MVVERKAGWQFLDDRQSLDALVNQMSLPDREEYTSYGSLAIEPTFNGRRFVVYTLRSGKPRDVEMLVFGDIELMMPNGCRAWFKDSQGDASLGYVPVRYRARDLYLQIPQSFTLKWKGKRTSEGKLQYLPHYAILVKSRSREAHQVEGDTYCVTFKDFTERFPSYRLAY